MERHLAIHPDTGGETERARSLLAAFGDLLQRRQDVIRPVQWGFVAVYLLLLFAPLLVPLAPERADSFTRAAHLTEALFWGLWWPAVILSMMLVGQFWCGLLCPDGTVTEFVSRHGRALKIPAWMRQAALPLLLFALLVVYEHMTQARHSHRGTVLVLGAVSGAALLTGLLYGRGKRVWCRYLCPTASIFSMLARCAMLHFKVDRDAWDRAPRPPKPVDCPPLLDVRRLASNEKCNMCGRCSGHRGAVRLAWRAPGNEIVTLGEHEVRGWEAAGIVLVLVGLFYGALHWQGSPWHAAIAARIGSVFADWQGYAGQPPWWLFVEPDTSATWVGAWSALLGIVLAAAVIGAVLGLLLTAAAGGRWRLACHLAYALIPLGGLGLMLGALEHSFAILVREGFDLRSVHLHGLRALVLSLALAWSAWLGVRILARARPRGYARILGCGIFMTTAALLAAAYQFAPAAIH